MDIVSVTRVRRLLAEYGEEFFDRMLTPGELADCRTASGLDVLSLCGRIAAKEASFKTLRVRGRFLPWLDIVVRRSEGGWPLVELRRGAAEMAAASGIAEITVSISHDVDYAVAVAAPVLQAGSAGYPLPPILPGPAGASAAPATNPSSMHSTSRRTTMSDGLQQVKNWLLARHTEREDIASDLDLIENRLIDSLSFVEFVFLLEQQCGRSIQMETLEVDEIRTLAAIESHFFPVEVEVGQA
ncbi:4'-phosphopantetheinyl transferase superfamily protein [Streptomyces sp. H27-H1]|uniref:4'-phosphopantetheinyl transferase superfamily protein n=1 Tax=Streptomyces sp. H27-H1 TaxID=2996461 RepID=UPI00226E5170|nr:4'-phosphopantetheinyl transferase superfamily protein [Streptomyces sp. H27-H1]MCY0928825.1 4'-phosphopantetheinyl transferase superfamily protein [Streptomyces sp. H27-H1]